MNPRQEFTLEPGEHVIREVRIHWFFFLTQLIPYLFLAILPLLLPAFINLGGPAVAKYITFAGWGPLGRVALGAWWLLLWSAAFNTFTRYYLNLWVMTNERIVEIKQRRFFDREVSSLLLNRVQDVTVDTHGVMDSFLHIGDINAQTAGTIDRFTMKNVPDPEDLRDLILRYTAPVPPPSGSGI